VARISQQAKDGLIVLVTIGVGLATGFFVDAWTKHENFALSLGSLIVLGLAQLFIAFIPSKDMDDLEKYRRDLEEYHKADVASLKLKNAMAAQAQKLAEEGKLPEALEWHNASAKL